MLAARTLRASKLGFLATLAVLSTVAVAQSHGRTNQANWKLAEKFTTDSMRPYLYSSNLAPGWINKSAKFWYVWRDSTGNKYWLVDCKAKKKEPLFDSHKMAALLTELSYRPIDSTTLNVGAITFDEKNDDILRFTVSNVRYEYNRKDESLKILPGRASGQSTEAPPPGQGRGGGQGGQAGQQGNRPDFRNFSPDRKSYVYAQNHNLFYVEIVDEKPTEPVQLTKDGEENYSFGARGSGQFQQRQEQEEEQEREGQSNRNETRVRANVTWSKDSKRFYVTRSDSRKVKDLFLVNSLSEPRPTLLTYRYAIPGEPDVTQIEMFAFERANKTLTKLDISRYKDQRIMDIHWQDTTSDKLRYTRRDRLQRNLEVCELDLATGKTTVLLTEKTENAFLESQGVRYVTPGGDFIWFSERTGWGHYYLYSNDGKLKNAITSGPWRASRVVEVDDKKGIIWVSGNGREEGENPYYSHLYKVGLDGKGLTLLDEGHADHSSTLSPDKDFVIDSASRIDMPTKIVLRDGNGKHLMDIEEMDVTRLLSAGWQFPEPFVVKAADGVNDIYGNMWKPSDFSPKKKYPIIAYVYPGPQTESVSSTFGTVSSVQRLAQLGFIVIQIGNRGGNPARSNAYHSFGYFNLRDYGLADKKAGIEELANRHPFIDLDRVGIYGHSGGGFMTGAALLLPPYNEFFKVGVSSAGNHDNNVYNQNWSEQHHGLREVPVNSNQGSSGSSGSTGRTVAEDPEYLGMEEWMFFDPEFQETGTKSGETKFEIKVPTNHEIAANLKGHLLLVHGDMDNNVHPAGTIRLVNALIKANKRFDFMLMPGKAHGFGDMQPYFEQMLMEYFAEHLLGDYYRRSSEMKDKGK
ncbi:DPP IV N-terminal domain-containing protein [Kamptonema cortianum]|nr:DPP IV N-terminal domain-containing protein [Geitlerinema splendidum]MDK3161206.1 DPP IV N-terminal domain-containing protein [Kamptonema cortianum]